MPRIFLAPAWTLTAILVLAGLAGCGGGRSANIVRTDFVEFSPEQIRQIEAADRCEYRLQASDIIKVAFAHQPNLNSDPMVILPDGAVTLIGVDRIMLAGLTLTEADSAITAAYSQEYRDPKITVIVLESSGRKVYVLGEVQNPGLVDLPRGGLDIVGAVARAGGFTPDAAEEGSVLVRVTPTGYMVKELDLSRFQDLDSLALATVDLQPFDVVYVPRSRIGDFAYFTKAVLSGLINITRIASDVRYLSDRTAGRY